MARRVIRAVLLAGMITAAVAAQGTVGVIRSRPLASPQEIANLEARVLRNPEDIDARLELLQFYLDTPPPRVDFAFAARGPVRLQYILYLVEHIRRHPQAHPGLRTCIDQAIRITTRRIMMRCAISGWRHCRLIRGTIV